MASTDPLEIVQADRWRKANKSLKGDKLKRLSQAKIGTTAWGPRCDAYCPLDDDGDLDWLEKLGDAVLAQQPMSWTRSSACAPRLRQAASSPRPAAKVTVTQEAEKQVIVIEPSSSEPPMCRIRAVGRPALGPTMTTRLITSRQPPVTSSSSTRYGHRLGSSLCHWQCHWDNFDWGHGNINVDIDKNVNFNRHVDRNNVHAQHWQHNAYTGVAWAITTSRSRTSLPTPRLKTTSSTIVVAADRKC